MSKTVLANVDGFVPVIDGMIEDVGLVCAAVFGKVWRYCQMPDGVCSASQERMSDELGIDRRTIIQHLDTLVEKGYLHVKKEIGKTNVYFDTGKANLCINLTGGVKINHTTCEKNSQVPVKINHSNIVFKKDTKREDNKVKFNTDENFKNFESVLNSFVQSSKITPPKETSLEFEREWDAPIVDMLQSAEGDSVLVCKNIAAAIARLDKSKYTINSPKSILKTVKSLIGGNKRGAPADDHHYREVYE